MGAAIGLRDDFDGTALRRLARTTKSANQGRRLLALAEIYDGASRGIAARNPVENNWQFMRDNWLSNRVFTSHENIVDHCCEAWNKLIDQPWRIMTIGRRQWASGS